MYKKIDLGNGLRLTQSDDMGIFLHFRSKSGNESGMKLSTGDSVQPGLNWASEILSEVQDEDATAKVEG